MAHDDEMVTLIEAVAPVMIPIPWDFAHFFTGKSRANGLLIESAPCMLKALEWIDGEAPTKEPRDSPTVGFQSPGNPEEDDGNETVAEAFREGVARGLWLAAEQARPAIAKALGK